MDNKTIKSLQTTAMVGSGQVVKDIVGESIRLLGKRCHPHLKQIESTVKAFNTVVVNVGALAEASKSVIQERQPYLDSLYKDLDDEDYFLGGRLSLATIFKSISNDVPPQEFTLASVVSGDAFRSMVITQYNATGLDEARKVHLEEALELHRLEFYSGSVCVLLTLLEGIITEALDTFGVIEKDHKGKFALRDKSARPLNLNGLYAKLNAGEHLEGKLRDQFMLIREKQFSSLNPGKHLPATRNDILHGTALGYNTEKNSVLLLLWLATTIVTIKEGLHALAP